MNSPDVERFFFRKPADPNLESVGVPSKSNKEFRPPPVHTDRAPFHLDLATVLPARSRAIRQAGQVVFHIVGDTGGVNGTGAQQNVADHMARQIRETELPDQPSFFYHLGDVVYYHGENTGYHDQFYFPYQDYPAPIFAIPGNHDGDTPDPKDTLAAFYEHFCAPEPGHSTEAGNSDRPTMTLPNCYWRLEAPFLTIVGLYSNVSGALDDPSGSSTPQRDWLRDQLRTAPADCCLLLAVHHPLYSLGKHGGTDLVRDAILSAVRDSGRMPDAIFTGHDHCYQRFTLKQDGRHVPVVVAGAGGFATYDDLTRVKENHPLPDGVKLEAYNDKRPGFLRLAVTAETLTSEYFTVPKPGREKKPAKRRDHFVLNLKKHRFV
jgi:acid phosphatase type 7